MGIEANLRKAMGMVNAITQETKDWPIEMFGSMICMTLEEYALANQLDVTKLAADLHKAVDGAFRELGKYEG